MQILLSAFGATLIVGTVAGVVLAIVYPLIRPGLLKRPPRQRANALLGWAVAPVGVGLFFTTLLFIPSLTSHLGIHAGHCHNHTERLPHICLINPLLSDSETLPWYLAVALTALLAGFLVAQGAYLYKIARFKAALHYAGRVAGADHSLFLWKKPAAITVGFWVPKIYISSSLAHAVSAEHFQVILAHEQGHVRHRDPLRQYLGFALSSLYLSRARQRILKDLTLATEQACDEEAAQITGDRLHVAETIAAVERLLRSAQREPETLAVGFTCNNSALRIEALLAERDYSVPLFSKWVLLSPPLAVTHLVMSGPLHCITHLAIRH